MDFIAQELKNRTIELKNFLKISVDHQKELAGAYKYVQHVSNPNSLEVCSNLKFGDHNSVINVETDDKSIIPFHTHLLSNNPPSGNDVIALIYQILNQKSEYAIVIDPTSLYIYTIRIILMGKLARIISINSPEKIDVWKEKFSQEIDDAVQQYHQDKNQVEYIQKMFDMGVDVRILPH